MKNHKLLFIVTLLYFALGFINIHFSLAGFVCMIFPFALLFKNTNKTWCQGYCPRANLYSHLGKTTSKFSFKTPKFFITGSMKWIMLGYFCLSLFIIIFSTIKVSQGMPALENLRFLLIFPFEGMPQMVRIESFPWLLHLSYRFYSMMMTTTILGLIMALIFRPRTWCTVCPIASVSDIYLKSKKS